ncbi:hypothetical protein SRIMM317S_05161 [Streptomyces rimosus subsp. rimosus]
MPARDGGAAGGVLTTVGQIGNAVGVAVLGVLFFAELDTSTSAGATPLTAYGDAFASVLPWQIAFYVVAAGLMMLLPSTRRRSGVAGPPRTWPYRRSDA